MACTVTIDDTNYYIDCDRVNDLEQIDGVLVNTSSSSLTLKNNFGDGTTYPYISCSSLSSCYLRTGYNSGSQVVRSAPVYEGDPFYIINFNQFVLILLILILGVKLLWKR